MPNENFFIKFYPNKNVHKIQIELNKKIITTQNKTKF